MNLWCGTNPEGAKDESVRELMERYHKAIKADITIDVSFSNL